MATVAEKVQGVSGEGHQKVKNDHEQFLEAYESKSNKEWLMREKNSRSLLVVHCSQRSNTVSSAPSVMLDISI